MLIFCIIECRAKVATPLLPARGIRLYIIISQWAFNFNFLENKSRVAEWSALQTGKREDSGSIPAESQNFFQRNQELRTIKTISFELNLNFKFIQIFSNYIQKFLLIFPHVGTLYLTELLAI